MRLSAWRGWLSGHDGRKTLLTADPSECQHAVPAEDWNEAKD
jgi:hypothetical protein